MGHLIEPLENVGFQFLSLRHRPKRPSFSIASRRSFGPVVRVVLGRTSGPRGGVAEGSRSLMAIFLPTSVPLRLGTELRRPVFSGICLQPNSKYSRCSDIGHEQTTVQPPEERARHHCRSAERRAWLPTGTKIPAIAVMALKSPPTPE